MTGWRVGYKILNIVELLPAFVARIEKDERLKVYGSFHFQIYKLNQWDTAFQFPATQTQSEDPRWLIVTPGALLVMEPTP